MFSCSQDLSLVTSLFHVLGESMGIKSLVLFSLLFSLNLHAYSDLYKSDYSEYTEITQVPEYYNNNYYTDDERCQIAKWVHENNSKYVRKMYLKGYKIHPNRIKSTSDDAKTQCDLKQKRQTRSPHRCGRYEDCLHEAEVYRLLIER